MQDRKNAINHLRERYVDQPKNIGLGNVLKIVYKRAFKDNDEHFNRFEEEAQVELFQCHFRLIDLTSDGLYDIGIPAITE